MSAFREEPWTVEHDGKKWIAKQPWDSRFPGDDEWNRVWLENGKLYLEDTKRFYPNGSYDIPLSVIDELRAKEER